jgi:hypothetical protein
MDMSMSDALGVWGWIGVGLLCLGTAIMSIALTHAWCAYVRERERRKALPHPFELKNRAFVSTDDAESFLYRHKNTPK